MFLLAMVFFSFFRTFLAAALGTALPAYGRNQIPVHTTVRIRPRPKNKPALFKPVDPPSMRYTRVPDRFLPARSCIRTTAGRRTYSTEVTSLFASNLPLHRSAHTCALHARSINITERLQNVKLFFVIFAEIFALFLGNSTNCCLPLLRSRILCPHAPVFNVFRGFLQCVERLSPSLHSRGAEQ